MRNVFELLWALEVDCLMVLFVDNEGAFDVDFFGGVQRRLYDDLGWDLDWDSLIFYGLYLNYLFYNLFDLHLYYLLDNYLSFFHILFLTFGAIISESDL